MVKLLRFYHTELGIRIGIQVDQVIYDASAHIHSIAGWLRSSSGRVSDVIDDLNRLVEKKLDQYRVSDFETSLSADHHHLLAPIDEQEVWAAGVTYERSRTARQEEAMDGGDIYALVFSSERPEIFYKASGRQVVGPFSNVGIRYDASWSVPEPELALVLNPHLQPVGFTIGNDMSSRDIEGANPLYLPQAKIYTASCALGPTILLTPDRNWLNTTIQLEISREGRIAFQGEISTERIHRSMEELIDYLGRCYRFPEGVVLLTGTGIVPPKDFSLNEGDTVSIQIEPIGTLTNHVIIIGKQ
jgi:2-dehydro-3-deoxy-D-arabinonate dehydratase